MLINLNYIFTKYDYSQLLLLSFIIIDFDTLVMQLV